MTSSAGDWAYRWTSTTSWGIEVVKFVHARFDSNSSETHVIFYNYDIARDIIKTKGSKMASSAGDSDYQWASTTSWGIELVKIRSRQIR